MIINNKYNFTYIHIPKTGGITLRKRLSEINGTYFHNPPHGSIKNYNTDGHYVFATIRNPFDWYVSFWSHERPNWSHDLYDRKKTNNFSQWLKGMLNLDLPIEHVYNVKLITNLTELDYKFHLYLYRTGIKLDNTGWLSHLTIFSCCKNFEELLANNNIDYICNNIKKYFNVNKFIQTSQLNDIHNYIDHPILHNHLKNTGPIHLNKGSHRESMKYYTEDMKKEVLEKDRLIFKLMKLSE